MSCPRYSVVIPCYGSERTIVPLIRRLRRVFKTLGESWEVLCVDDCSPDNVSEQVLKARKVDRRVKLIRLCRNYGQQRAILTGLRYVRGEFVITMDDDLQNPPEEIPELIAALGDNDVVCGRPVSKKHGLLSNLGSSLVSLILQVAHKPPATFHASSFRLFRREIADTMAGHRTVYPHLASMLLVITRKFATVDVRHDARRSGKSNYSLLRLLSLASNLLINYTKIPLHCMVGLGVAISGCSMVFMGYLIGRRLLDVHYQAGWPSLMVTIIFFGGLNLLSLAVIGEYLIRMLNENSTIHDVMISEEHADDSA